MYKNKLYKFLQLLAKHSYSQHTPSTHEKYNSAKDIKERTVFQSKSVIASRKESLFLVQRTSTLLYLRCNEILFRIQNDQQNFYRILQMFRYSSTNSSKTHFLSYQNKILLTIHSKHNLHMYISSIDILLDKTENSIHNLNNSSRILLKFTLVCQKVTHIIHKTLGRQNSAKNTKELV